jgi:hypothetical protein
MNNLHDKIGLQLKLLLNSDNYALKEEFAKKVDLSEAKMKICVEVIESIYSNILLRPVDSEGIKSLYSLIESDPVIETIIRSLCNSDEAKENHIRYQNLPKLQLPTSPPAARKQPGLFGSLKRRLRPLKQALIVLRSSTS